MLMKRDHIVSHNNDHGPSYRLAMRTNLEFHLSQVLGAKVASKTAERFVAAVMGRKREIEAAAGTIAQERLM